MSLEIIFDKDFYKNFTDYKNATNTQSHKDKRSSLDQKEIDLSTYDYFKEINVSRRIISNS